MAITLQAVELKDERKLSESQVGWQGSRVYVVSTGSINVAVFGNTSGPVQGLPVKGEPWHATKAPNLIVNRREFERDGGIDSDSLNQTGGWTRVIVKYGTLGLNGELPPPVSQIKFVRIVPTITTVQAIYGIDPTTGQVNAGEKQIADGQGAPRDVGLISYDVFVPLSPTDFALLDTVRLIRMHSNQSVNSNAIDLPPYLGSARFDHFTAGQLRFRGFSIDEPDETGYRYLKIAVSAALDHKFRWTSQAADGGASPVSHTADLYPTELFAGLW